MNNAKADLYFSCDVETDGPVPGPYSLVSIGLAVVGSFDGERFERRDPRRDTFYAELKPISDRWDANALAVSGLTREHLISNGADPGSVFPELNRWVRNVAKGFKPVFVAYPLGFDWTFSHYYSVMFGDTPGSLDNCAFGFSNALDMKTIYATKAKAPVGRSTKRWMPKRLFGAAPHTHNALDDAVEQGELFCNLMEWDGRD